jgi:hydrogenase maturation protein HypF
MGAAGTDDGASRIPGGSSGGSTAHESMAAERLRLGGRVQGVGFRPFVYRMAHAHGIVGWVRNDGGEVDVHAEGAKQAVVRFADALLREAPPLARPAILSRQSVTPESHTGFEILTSGEGTSARAHLPPDYFLCDDCRRELEDPQDRRYRYPFINCTQCGPRYTLITRLPYDRAHTTMAGFEMCEDCRREYEDPLDRRFHAEPIACPACGPRLQLYSEHSGPIDDNEAGLRAASDALRRGFIVAVKGIGGYHLLCDAANDKAVRRLRLHKRRPHKPLAVMFPASGADGLDAVRAQTHLEDAHAELLLDPMRPIVLVPRRSDSSLSPALAPGLNEIGIFLPYSPLHHLLLADLDRPMVATSGNVSGEPVITDNVEAEERLAFVAEAFLHHDRPIRRPADDSVFRVIAGQGRPLRLGRGSAPVEMRLPFRLREPVLAVGGHMKNTVALAWEDRAVLSPHIGDLDAPRSLAVFEQVIEDLQSLYGVRAGAVVCDAHPGYASSRWASGYGLPLVRVWHHHAHASAVAGEYSDETRWLVFTWDGVGLGPDETLWGGDALLGSPGAWQHAARLRPFRLPGGDRAARDPWRSALALCWEAGIEWHGAPADTDLLRLAWERSVNAPTTSAAGRVFDAAAALTGLCVDASFEGQGPMHLEAACVGPQNAIALPLACDDDGVWQSDWAPLLPMLLDEGTGIGERAGCFHASLARVLCEQAKALRDVHGDFAVGLAGGVFQNRVLTETTLALLDEAGFRIYLPRAVPCNDGGLCYGQIIEAGNGV